VKRPRSLKQFTLTTALVENYRFGTRTCDFLIRRRCGVSRAPAVVSEIAAMTRPIVRPNLELPFEVRNHARTMATAERACARPQRIVIGRLRT
jgi:hypothetical protein